MWQYVAVILIGIATMGYIAYKAYRMFTKPSNPCNGCDGCALKKELGIRL